MRRRWTALRSRVLRRIRPSDSLTRRAHAAAEAIRKATQDKADRLGLAIKPVLVGSLSKDTHLIPTPDIDVFLLFPPDTSREDLERHGIRIGRAVLSRPRLKYAEHPYVHGSFRGFDFDVVPAYEVLDPRGRLSAVDRSPWHAEYVRKRLRPGQRDEVRILKRFLKGIGCYGADTATGGFSGYLAELLILKYRDFWSTLEAFAKARPPTRLALSRNPPPMGGELVFVDPVDPTRNAAAAVAPAKLATFVRAARAFIAGPSERFFWAPKVVAASSRRLERALGDRGILAMPIPRPSVRADAAEPHLRRFAAKVARRLADEGFAVLRQDVLPLGRTAYLLLFEHDPVELPAEYEHVGPPGEGGPHARRFTAKWRDHPETARAPWFEDGRWRVRVRRVLRTPADIVAAALPTLLEGVDLKPAARKRIRVVAGSACIRIPGARLPLTRFLDPREPWQPARRGA